MIRIVAETDGRRLPFYLALEEWVARCMPAAEYFFGWTVDPTIIIGRNQDMAAEVDMAYCRDHGIQLYRRRSGGGCVYADRDNIMLSYITPSTDVTTTFAGYTQAVARMLRSLGVDARATGRNDILVDGCKVSGNAFYHLPGRSIVHGTLLYSTDMRHMANALTPARSKLESKRVSSVDRRITTLDRYLPDMGVAALMRYMDGYFTDSSYTLSADEQRAVEQIEQRYYDSRWTAGRHSACGGEAATRHISRRVPGVGCMDIDMRLDGDTIRDIDILGDYFLLSDLDTMLLDRLRGCRLSAQALTAALADVDLSRVIANLDNAAMVDILTDNR